jgi:hypothetical protein
MTKEEVMVNALRILAEDMESSDGVPNQCLRDAAVMIEGLVEHYQHMLELVKNHNCESITDLAVKCRKQATQIEDLKEIIASYERLAADGIYYTVDQLNKSRKEWVLSELTGVNQSEFTKRILSVRYVNQQINALEDAKLTFPISLRKMWSGYEFLDFLDRRIDQLKKENNI